MVGFSWQQFGSWFSEDISSSDFSQPLSAIAVDSRDVIPGALFFALRGARTDGHLFLEQAALNGAVAAVIEKGFDAEGKNYGMRLFYVDDTLKTLQTAAKKWLALSSGKVIAITGSLGKTTTKGFLYQLLQKKYRVSTTSGSKNSQIGLSLAILNETKGDEEYIILEMGMSHPGQIKTLVEIAPPYLSIVTNIALVHAENFETLAEIAYAKAEIFSHPSTQYAIINRGAACADILIHEAHCETITYSGTDFTVSEEGLEFFENGQKIKLPYIYFPASHVYQNLFAAITTARQLGMSTSEIATALPTLMLPEKRLQEIEKKGVLFINDTYNAAEESMKGALEALSKKSTQGRKIAVLGHMRELGKFSDECHKNVGKYAINTADMLFCLGENCQPLVDTWKEACLPVYWFLDFNELLEQLQKMVVPGDVVLVKGARSLQLERVVENF
ncbi:MAG: murF [Chlamydiia bacterium]|nr:murF [Chlamydiia bacterium]